MRDHRIRDTSAVVLPYNLLLYILFRSLSIPPLI